jgi:pimeloyl-ACP methyl ester carboxylesterase
LSGGILPLLLLPGTLCDARLFAPLLEAIGPYPHQVADMTGARSTPELAARILSAAPERFALLGFSLGGIVALEMAAQAPGRIDRLALVDTTPRPDPHPNAAARRSAVARARALGMVSYIEDGWARSVAATHLARADIKGILIAMAEDLGPDALADQSEVAIVRHDSRPRLGAIIVPTLILAGADEQVCPIAAHEELAHGIPGSNLILIPNAGHFALLEKPADLAPHIRQWLGAEAMDVDPTPILHDKEQA